MAKTERVLCEYALYPLGQGLPLCAYSHVKKRTLATATIKDFPMCQKSECPKKKEE